MTRWTSPAWEPVRVPEDAANGQRALVLGGGGVAGIAWEVGVLARLAELGIDLAAQADLVVGTSAGACVGALVRGPGGYDTLVATQRLPVGQTKERMPDVDLDLVMEVFGLIAPGQDDPAEARRTVGAIAMATETVPEDERREIIAWRLPSEAWPDRPLIVTAVDAETGERVTFDGSSAVSLVDAVAASCAVPGIWPPVTIGGRRYIDGGVYSTTNADLAKGYGLTVVLRPLAIGGDDAYAGRTEATPLHPPLVVVADTESVEAFGPNPRDPATRGPALGAGMRQGEEAASEIERYWSA